MALVAIATRDQWRIQLQIKNFVDRRNCLMRLIPHEAIQDQSNKSDFRKSTVTHPKQPLR